MPCRRARSSSSATPPTSPTIASSSSSSSSTHATRAIQDLFAHPRKPGREQDTHDLLEQFTSIADELNDNLDDYGPHHRDIRKVLPKLIDATERWASNIKQPPENPVYDLSRKLALESIRDIREEATHLVEDQKTWFAAHPPAKEPDNVPAREVPHQPS